MTAVIISVGTTTASTINNNTVQNISITTTSTSTSQNAFRLQNGAFTMNGNTIGRQDITGSISFSTSGASALFSAISCGTGTTGQGAITISNNTIGGISIGGAGTCNFRGISFQSGGIIASTQFTISGNTIGSTTTANSIQNSTNLQILGIFGAAAQTTSTNSITGNTIANLSVTSTGTAAQLTGILAQGSAGGIYSTTSNTVRNLSSTATNVGTGSSACVIGISHTAATTTGQTVSQNTVHTLTNSTAGATVVVVIGINYTGPTTGTNTIARNFVHSNTLSSTSTSAVLTGIQVNSGLFTLQNNMVRLGINAAGTSITTGYLITGINDVSATAGSAIIHNSVFIGGAGVTAGASNTIAFNTATTTNTRTFRNNIFANDKTNSGGTGLHLAAVFAGTIPGPAGLTASHNAYYSSTSSICIRNSATNYTVSTWQTASAVDANSGQPTLAQINFVLATGTSSTVDLHVQSSTAIEASGTSTTTATDDYDGGTRSSLTPVDIGADAGNFTFGTDVFPPSVSFTALANRTVGNTSLSSFAIVTDNVGVSTGANLPRIYYKKSTDADAFVGNTSADNGWKYVAASNSSSPFSFTLDYSIINGGSGTVTTGIIIQYFVVAQDDANNFISSAAGATASANPPVQNINGKPTATINTFTILGSLSGAVTVGSGGTYSTLTAASGLFADINAKLLAGNVTATILSNITEDGVNSLNQWLEEGAGNYTLTIQSDGSSWVLSGTAVATAVPMVNINGADRVTISGGSGAQRLLTFRNTNATVANTGASVQFTIGSTSCTLNNCTIENNGTSTTRGSVMVGTGTNSVTITANDLRDATAGTTGAPANAVYASGTTSASTVTITSNNIYNFTNAGILLPSTSLADGGTITGNSIYQSSAPASVTGATVFIGISVQSGSGHTISNNYIGGQAANAGGSAYSNTAAVAFTGISLGLGTTSASSVQNNTIQNISLTSALASSFVGITSSAGTLNIGTVTGNTIGHASTANSISHTGTGVVTGINISSSGAVSVQNSTIANLTSTSTSGSGNNVVGIIASSSTTAYTISSNSIYSLKSGSTSSGGIGSAGGISFSGSNNTNVVSQNTIYNLENTNAGAVNPRVIGIYTSSTMGGTIRRNRIYNFIVASANSGIPDLRGIYMFQGGSPTLTLGSNQISLGTGVTNNVVIYGIADNTTTTFNTNLFYNTIYIGGTVTTGTTNTAALSRQLAAITNAKNNFYYNERSGGTGSHYAISFTTGATTAWTSDNNIYVAGNTANVGEYGTGVPKTFTTWKAAATGDANGYSYTTVSVPSASTFTAIASGDLSLTSGYRAIVGARGTAVAETVDYAGTARNATPAIGSIEYTGQAGSWMGFTSTAYSTATNWSDGVVATSGTNVTVPTYAINMPALGGSQAVNDLVMQSGTTLSIGSNTFTVNGAMSGSGFLTGSSTSNLTINGSGTVNFDQASSATRTLNNLVLNSGSTVTLGNATIVATGLTLTAGTLSNGANLTLSNGATITRAAGTLSSAPTFTTSANLTYTGSTAVSTGNEMPSTSTVLNDLVNNNTGGVTFSGAITVNGNWTTGAGAINNAGAFTHNLKGNWSNSGTLNASTGKFIFSGTGGQTMSGSTFYDLEIDNAAGVSMLTDQTVSNILTLTNGIFIVGSNTLTLNGGAIAVTPNNLTTSPFSNLTFGGSSSGVSVPSGVTNLATLTINNTNAAGVTLNGNITLATGLVINTSGVLDAGTNQLLGSIAATINGTLKTSNTNGFAGSGTYTIPAGTALGSASTIEYKAGSPQSVDPRSDYANLTLSAGGAKTFAGNSSVAVNFTVSGGAVTAPTLMTFNGTSAQNIAGLTYTDVAMSGAGTKTFTSNGSLSGTMTFAASTGAIDFDGSGNNIVFTLKSNSSNTASIANTNGTTLNGKVTMERWIPLRTGGTGRAYRLLAPTVNTTGSIRTNWMEGGMNICIGFPACNDNPLANYGTQISGAGGNNNEFDVTQSNASSFYSTTNGVTPTYAAIGSTTGTLNALTGYFLFVRSDRSMDMTLPQATGMPTSSTTLRTTGTLVTGTQTTFTNTLIGSGALNLVTNPYASPIDWSLVQLACANVTTSYTLWDPNVGTRGGFVTVTTGGSVSGGSTATIYIQPGQAFFVESSGGVPTVSIQEAHKAAGNNNGVFRTATTVESFRTELYFTEPNNYRRIADGVIALYDNSYSTGIDANDAKEINNWDENIAIDRSGNHLAIEGRPVILTRDTLPLFMNNMRQMAYEFEFTPSLFSNIGLKAELIDNFLNTRTILSVTATTVVPFTVTSNPASSATDRFMVVFGPQSPLAVADITIRANKNGNGVKVDWTSRTETDMDHYEVERSATGSNFARKTNVAAIGNSSSPVNYSWFDANPVMGNNFYRIKGFDRAGNFKYSPVVKVLFGKNDAGIVVYPNPVNGNSISIDLNNMAKGIYKLSLINNLGQEVFSETVQHEGGSATKTITWKQALPNGVYQLVLKGENGIKLTQKIIKN